MAFHNIFSQTHKPKPNVKPKILIDHREKNSLVISELVHLGCDYEFKQLPVADFLTSGVAIERKTIDDFISSMKNKRLIRQLEELQQYPKKLLIVEGIEEQELYNDAKDWTGMHPNAVRGFLLSILLNYQVPIIFSKNYKDTAKFIFLLAKKKPTETGLNAKKKSLNKKEQLQYIIEGFPGIGPKTAKKLLEHFKSIKEIVNVSEEQLKEILGKKSESVFKLINENY